jgi:phosphate transport system substrate-binding protein
VLVQGVSQDVNAIGYFGYAYYAENQSRLKAVPIVEKAGKPAVGPSEASVLDGSYEPLSARSSSTSTPRAWPSPR